MRNGDSVVLEVSEDSVLISIIVCTFSNAPSGFGVLCGAGIWLRRADCLPRCDRQCVVEQASEVRLRKGHPRIPD